MPLNSSTGDLRGGLTVSYANACCDGSVSRARRGGGIARVWGAWVLGAVCWGAGTLAQAQSAAPAPKADSSLTWNGITLYGIVDVGVQYQTHLVGERAAGGGLGGGVSPGDLLQPAVRGYQRRLEVPDAQQWASAGCPEHQCR